MLFSAIHVQADGSPTANRSDEAPIDGDTWASKAEQPAKEDGTAGAIPDHSRWQYRTPAACTGSLKVPIKVGEYANAARKFVPVSGGIPFPRGTLQDSDLPTLGLADEHGNQVLSLQEPIALGHWNDGSIKWLLLDFMADVPALGLRQLTLCKMDSQPIPIMARPHVSISEDDVTFTVDTGRLKTVLGKTSFRLFEKTWVDVNRDGAYDASEQVSSGPAEMFVDLDDAPPGDHDTGVYNYPDTYQPGMEGGNWLRSSQATGSSRYLASKGEFKIEVFRQGATHTIFRVEGWHKNEESNRQFAKYSLYLHFYAGASFVRISHTWIMTGDPEKNFIRRMALELPVGFAQGTLEYAFGGAFEKPGEPIRFSEDEPPFVPITRGPSEIHSGTIDATTQMALVSIGPDKYYHNIPLGADRRVGYELLKNGSAIQEGYGASGWESIFNRNKKLGLAFGVQDFWREHPKEVRYEKGKVGIYLWPDHGGKTLDLRRRYPEIRGTESTLGKAARREFEPAGSAVGLAKTTDLFLYFFGGTHVQADVDTVFRGFEDALRPIATPEWNMGSGVFGKVHPYDMTKFPRTENFIDLTFAWPMRSAEEYSWYGWLDFGDHLLEYESLNWELNVPANWGLYSNWGYSGWTQENYRYGQWMMLQYLRSGRHFYWTAADRWLRHHRDVDCVFWDVPDDGTRPSDNKGGPRLGAGHRHDQQHWGAYLTGYGIPEIATTHHYFLTGEGRDLDALRLYANWIQLPYYNHIENYGAYTLLYMAEALGDPQLVTAGLSQNVPTEEGFGRVIYASGMGLLLHDIQTNGAAEARQRLRTWADQPNTSFAFIRGYLESEEHTGKYKEQLKQDFETIFPPSKVRTYYFSFAPRVPQDFRDAFSPDIMPDGPWAWPATTIQHLLYDGPFGMVNAPSRNMFIAQLPWIMDAYGQDP